LGAFISVGQLLETAHQVSAWFLGSKNQILGSDA